MIPERKFFRADDGCDVPYVDFGFGAPLVYLVGFGETPTTIRGILERLSADFRVLSFERRDRFSENVDVSNVQTAPAFGVDRLAGDLRALLETLDLRDVSVVGYSMGGTVLFSYLRQFGTDRIARVVFADATPKLENDADWKLGLWRGRYSQADLNRDLDAIENDAPFFRLRFFLRASTPTRPDETPADFALPDDQNALLERAAEATGIRPGLLKRVFFAERSSEERRADRIYWETMARADFRAVLPNVDVPALVAFADPGSFYSPKTAEYTARHIPNATLAPILDATHASFAKEKAPEFLRAVADFCLSDRRAARYTTAR